MWAQRGCLPQPFWGLSSPPLHPGTPHIQGWAYDLPCVASSTGRDSVLLGAPSEP